MYFFMTDCTLPADPTFHSSFFDILFIFPFSVSPWCWKLVLPAFGRIPVEHALRNNLSNLFTILRETTDRKIKVEKEEG